MLTVKIVSANPLWGNGDQKSSAQEDSQLIEEYRKRYLPIAVKAQRLNKLFVFYTYDQLYKLGCDHEHLGYKIDLFVGYELRLSLVSLIDQINILFYGPYVQSQISHHKLSELDARRYIYERLALGPTLPASIELGQVQPVPIAAA